VPVEVCASIRGGDGPARRASGRSDRATADPPAQSNRSSPALSIARRSIIELVQNAEGRGPPRGRAPFERAQRGSRP
jgi:hypothetical protein